MLAACSGKDKYSADDYFSPSERDTLLADMITYIYAMPQYASTETRFGKEFRAYYVENLKQFRFEKYYQAPEGIHYFYLIRPARSAEGSLRGVGGKFRLDANKKITSFEEIFNTPASDLKTLQERGERLFNEMIRKGNVDDYLRNPDYIEWPGKTTYYDTTTHEWKLKPS